VFVVVLLIGFKLFYPWTHWETMRTIKYGGSDKDIVFSINYLGTHTEYPEYPEYPKYIIQYINDCKGGIESTLARGYIYKFPVQFADAANWALENLTNLNFGYEWLDDCEGPQNQAAIQAWKDWYENDYDDWLKQEYEKLTDTK
jgi:hypothetical protein